MRGYIYNSSLLLTDGRTFRTCNSAKYTWSNSAFRIPHSATYLHPFCYVLTTLWTAVVFAICIFADNAKFSKHTVHPHDFDLLQQAAIIALVGLKTATKS